MGIQKMVGSCQMGGSCVRGGSDPCLSEQGPKSIQVCDFCWRVVLGRLVINFLPRSKRLLISWLQSESTMILEPPQIKSDTVSTVSPSISHEVMGPDAMIFVF